MRKAAGSGGAGMTVKDLRRWIDEPTPMGLPKECANLIILVFAAQTNRSFFLHNGPFDPSITNLQDEVELREQQLPSETDWLVALERAGRIFGAASSPLLNAPNLAKLADEIQVKANGNINDCRQLVENLKNYLPDHCSEGEKAPRYQTATAVLDLLEVTHGAKPARVIEALAELTPQTSEAAMGTSFATAGSVVNAISSTQWMLFENMGLIQDDRSIAANALLSRVADALRNDQHVTALEPVLKIEQKRAIELLKPQLLRLQRSRLRRLPSIPR